MTEVPWRRHVTAAAVLAAAVWFGAVNLPALDTVSASKYRSQAKRDALVDSIGAYGYVTLALSDTNYYVRQPIIDALLLESIMPVFRISQTWNLYSGAGSDIVRLEVWVDDRKVYRTNSSDYDFLAWQLRSRKLRPMVQVVATKETAQNSDGLVRYIAEQARAAWPDAHKVEVLSKVHKAHQPETEAIEHHFVSAAPGWAVVELQ